MTLEELDDIRGRWFDKQGRCKEEDYKHNIEHGWLQRDIYDLLNEVERLKTDLAWVIGDPACDGKSSDPQDKPCNICFKCVTRQRDEARAEVERLREAARQVHALAIEMIVGDEVGTTARLLRLQKITKGMVE